VKLNTFIGKLEKFHYLTEICTEINICGDNKDTTLYLVGQWGSVGIIKLLLDKEVF